MNSSKLFFFCLSFFGFVYATRFDLDVLKNKPLETRQKKIDTVVVKKKGSFGPLFFLNYIKNKIGLAFFFERIIPHSWKKMAGLRRSFVIEILTTVTAMTNLFFVCYGIVFQYPFCFQSLALYVKNTCDQKPSLDNKPTEPVVIENLSPAVSVPVIQVDNQVLPSVIDTKPINEIGEFE